MKRNLIYFLLLVVLALAAYFLVIKKPWGTLNVDETAFSVSDTSAISKIMIADMQGQRVVIQRQKNFWMVNQKFPVRSDYMNVLLSTLKQVSVNYPVAKAAMDKVVSELAAHNKKVEVYDKNGKLLKAYFVGGPTPDAQGTYMLMEGSKNPYVTGIAGFQGVLETRYLTDEQAMRSQTIFDFKLNEIKKVTVTYPAKPDSSFSISVLGPDSFLFESPVGAQFTSAKTDKEKIFSYLNLFRFINCEAYANDLPSKDTILQSQPFCIITLADRDTQSHAVACYRMPLQQDSPEQFDQKGNQLQFDNDRYFATINNGRDFVIIQRFHFGRLFKNGKYFVVQPKTHAR